MSTANLKIIFITLSALVISGCSGILKATPIAESHEVKSILTASNGELKADENGLFPFNHTWNSGYCAVDQGTQVYVTPVNISRVDASNLSKGHLKQEDLMSIADYAQKTLKRAFSEQQKNFHVVDQPPADGRVVELSVVELTGTEVARNVLGSALGAFVPGGGLVSFRSSGTIGVEGVVREAKTGKPLFVFADRERGKTAPFSFNDFTKLSHARAAIDDWSEQIVASCIAKPGTRIPDRSLVTLLPL